MEVRLGVSKTVKAPIVRGAEGFRLGRGQPSHSKTPSHDNKDADAVSCRRFLTSMLIWVGHGAC